MIDLNELIEKANALAPFPASTVKLAQLVTSADYNMADVVDLIAYDPSLTMKLLRAANSAANGSTTKIATAKDAVARLGTAQVLSLAVASSAKPHLESGVPAYKLDKGGLWKHSVAAAVAAEVARSYCSVSTPPEAFTAALLHDIGKAVMGEMLSPEILNYISMARTVDHLSQLEAEREILTVNHAELGGLIAQHWQLPAGIVAGITYHHEPSRGFNVICDFTYLADQVAKRNEASVEDRKTKFMIPRDVTIRLGAVPNRMDNLCTAASSRFGQVCARYDAV